MQLPVLDAVSTSPRPSLLRMAGVVLLLLIGVLLLRVLGENPWSRTHLPLPDKKQWIILAAAVVVGLLPPVARWAGRVHENLRNPSPTVRTLTTLIVAVVAGGYLTFTAFHQHRILGPQWHDEHSYLIQMQMLAHGRLWLPRHPLGQFFETFHLITDPVYASKYFPGASLILLPTVLLHLPTWVMPVIVSSLAVAMTYRVICELIDGSAGVLASVGMLALLKFRMVSTMTLSQSPMLLTALLIAWSWLRWRKSHSLIWAVVIGFLGALALLTRSLDAICYALPIGLAMLLEMRSIPVRSRVQTLLLIAVAAAPLLLVQLWFNHGVTGHYTATPWSLYAKQSDPLDALGTPKPDPTSPPSTLAEKVAFRATRTEPAAAMRHRESLIQSMLHWRLGRVMEYILPTSLLLVFIPISLFGLTDRRRLVLALTLPLMIVAYSFYTFYSEYYFVTVAPAALMLVLLGMRQLARSAPCCPSAVGAALSVGFVALCITALPEITGGSDEWWRGDVLVKVNETIAKLPHKPAVVLFTYSPTRRIDAEPVFNIDTPWPDDATVIRAHDRGLENLKLARYFVDRGQADRAFYRFDEGTGETASLGTAIELVHQSPQSTVSPE